MAIKLPKITEPEHKSGKYNVTLNGATTADLELYVAGHAEAYGEAISSPERIIESIITLWLANNKEFQAYKREQKAAKPAAANRSRRPSNGSAGEPPAPPPFENNFNQPN
jgi:hypothetical protein